MEHQTSTMPGRMHRTPTARCVGTARQCQHWLTVKKGTQDARTGAGPVVATGVYTSSATTGITNARGVPRTRTKTVMEPLVVVEGAALEGAVQSGRASRQQRRQQPLRKSSHQQR